ncbi:glucose-6-phosphate isomerase [Candidatus Peregrinibacteria bacterium]|nr:glucose-6-phosphate isomerase [Candidatus Peregrinibacteria bacterium]
MISFDLKNLQQNITANPETIADFLKKIANRKQGFYEIVDDKKTLADVKSFAKKMRGKYQDVVILGIGGSALGAICLEQSLTHLFKKNAPRLHVLDNIDPTLISELEDVIDYKKTLFLVITKSGTTPETITQYFYFRDKTNKKKLDPKKHFVFITDPKNGFLRELATEERINSFAIPENVGGRFSVLTAVGLLPAALIGLNIDKLLAGARMMRDQFLSTNFEKNLPFQLAKIQYEFSKKGKNINVMIPYAQKIFRLADWYRQLLAESIGKKNLGITPINALGVTDQHSQLQLFNEGPNDKLFIFIEVKKFHTTLKIPKIYQKSGLDFLDKNITFNQLLQIEKDATAESLTKNNRPNFTIKIDAINEENLGALFMLFEGATAFLGEMFQINAFDQPGVELSKKLTKRALLNL